MPAGEKVAELETTDRGFEISKTVSTDGEHAQVELEITSQRDEKAHLGIEEFVPTGTQPEDIGFLPGSEPDHSRITREGNFRLWVDLIAWGQHTVTYGVKGAAGSGIDALQDEPSIFELEGPDGEPLEDDAAASDTELDITSQAGESSAEESTEEKPAEAESTETESDEVATTARESTDVTANEGEDSDGIGVSEPDPSPEETGSDDEVRIDRFEELGPSETATEMTGEEETVDESGVEESTAPEAIDLSPEQLDALASRLETRIDPGRDVDDIERELEQLERTMESLETIAETLEQQLSSVTDRLEDLEARRSELVRTVQEEVSPGDETDTGSSTPDDAENGPHDSGAGGL